jgi:DNA repair exonuclease SbcCD nuclease subunit
MKALVIGDPHFKYNSDASESEEYVKKIISIAQKHTPLFIVVLGDVLDTHEIVRVQPHKLAESLLEGLSNVAHTYVLMGNHDYINNSQFLTDNHVFGPFKKWPNLTIVDKVIGDAIEDKYFVFVPYVPSGKFSDALDTLVKDGETWEFADCIFAHQEFRGCRPRMADDKYKSKTGDVWDEDFPLIISGHIHKAQNVGKNIMYPGNSFQHSYKETCNKYVWIVQWEEEIEEPRITKISTGMKKKKIVSMSLEDLKEKDDRFFEEQSKFNLRINLIGTTAEFNNFRTSKLYNKLTASGTIFSYELPKEKESNKCGVVLSGAKKSDVSYDRVLHDIVLSKSNLIKHEYEQLFGKLDTKEKNYIEIEFVSESGSLTSDDQ